MVIIKKKKNDNNDNDNDNFENTSCQLKFCIKKVKSNEKYTIHIIKYTHTILHNSTVILLKSRFHKISLYCLRDFCTY